MTMFGWAVACQGSDVVVLDEQGRWRARFRRPSAGDSRRPAGQPVRPEWLERNTTSTITSPDGPIDVFNGKPYALTRHSQNGQAIAGGHVYDFWHDSSRWTHVMRDGRSIARIHRSGRSGAGTAEAMTFGDLDDTDRLMVVLGQNCIGPGRPGFLVSVVHAAVRLMGELRPGERQSRPV